MHRCKMVELFFALIPLKPWRSFLIRRHVENCPRCLADLASREMVGTLLVRETAVNISRSLWTEVEAAVREVPGGKRAKDQGLPSSVMRRWGWAVATAFLGVLLLSFLLLRDFQPGRVAANAIPARFELEYVRVGGRPANTVIYQPQGSDMIIVWAGTSN